MESWWARLGRALFGRHSAGRDEAHDIDAEFERALEAHLKAAPASQSDGKPDAEVSDPDERFDDELFDDELPDDEPFDDEITEEEISAAVEAAESKALTDACVNLMEHPALATLLADEKLAAALARFTPAQMYSLILRPPEEPEESEEPEEPEDYHSQSIPVENRHSGRWFRASNDVSPEECYSDNYYSFRPPWPGIRRPIHHAMDDLLHNLRILRDMLSLTPPLASGDSPLLHEIERFNDIVSGTPPGDLPAVQLAANDALRIRTTYSEAVCARQASELAAMTATANRYKREAFIGRVAHAINHATAQHLDEQLEILISGCEAAQKPVSDLVGLDAPTVTALTKAGIKTVRDLLQLGTPGLDAISGIGPARLAKTVSAIRSADLPSRLIPFDTYSALDALTRSNCDAANNYVTEKYAHVVRMDKEYVWHLPQLFSENRALDFSLNTIGDTCLLVRRVDSAGNLLRPTRSAWDF